MLRYRRIKEDPESLALVGAELACLILGHLLGRTYGSRNKNRAGKHQGINK